MVHLWNMGCRRLCWITATPDLLQDARRDLQDVGAAHIPLLDFRRVHRYSSSSGGCEGASREGSSTGTSIEAWRRPRGRGRPRKASGERKAKKPKTVIDGEESIGHDKTESCSSPSSGSGCRPRRREGTAKKKKGHDYKDEGEKGAALKKKGGEGSVTASDGPLERIEGLTDDEQAKKQKRRRREPSSPRKTKLRGKRKREVREESGAEGEWEGDGIVFAAYAILVATSQANKVVAEGPTGCVFGIQAAKSRFDQLLEWLQGGKAFVVLDECHKAKNVKVGIPLHRHFMSTSRSLGARLAPGRAISYWSSAGSCLPLPSCIVALLWPLTWTIWPT